MTEAEVMEEVMKDKIFYDASGGGITITGGEPSYQADFTLNLLRLAKNAGISLAIGLSRWVLQFLTSLGSRNG